MAKYKQLQPLPAGCARQLEHESLSKVVDFPPQQPTNLLMMQYFEGTILSQPHSEMALWEQGRGGFTISATVSQDLPFHVLGSARAILDLFFYRITSQGILTLKKVGYMLSNKDLTGKVRNKKNLKWLFLRYRFTISYSASLY